MELHPSQRKLLKFLGAQDALESLSLWEIARRTGLKNAQNVSHHLGRLEKYGYLRRTLHDPSRFELLKEPVEDVAYVNVYGYAQCGSQRDLVSANNVTDRIAISTRLLGVNPAKAFALRARGDSMEPYIHQRDLVVFVQKDMVASGCVAAIIHDGQAKIKRVTINGQRCVLSSTNPKYKDEEAFLGENLLVVGEAKGIFHGI